MKDAQSQHVKALMRVQLDAAYHMTRETLEYDSWVSNSIALSRLITDKLGENRQIFFDYEELSTLKEDALIENMYRQGFQDGLNILNGVVIGRNWGMKTCPKRA